MQTVFFSLAGAPISHSHRDEYRQTKLPTRARYWPQATESMTQISKRTLFPVLGLSSFLPIRAPFLLPCHIPFGAGSEPE